VTNWLEVNDWYDLAANAWIGLVLIAVAVVPSWLSLRNHRSIKEVSDSVNNRPTALRTDVDEIRDTLNAIRDDIISLRGDLLTERESRRSQVDDLRSDFDRMRRR
jgi:predicted nuclease with TOPRIM domain